MLLSWREFALIGFEAGAIAFSNISKADNSNHTICLTVATGSDTAIRRGFVSMVQGGSSLLIIIM